MPEYIEREAVLKHKTLIPGFVGEYVSVKNIEETPTADVVEVKHGEWIANRAPVEVAFICSECKYSYFFADPEEECEYNFCPHCGAKMDLKEGAEE